MDPQTEGGGADQGRQGDRRQADREREHHPGTDALHPAPPTPQSERRAGGSDVDVLVIGGGIQGVGAAQAAAAAGHTVALLERSEAAIGTSSRSSKLIHGGLRYLETYQFRLVRESLNERKILQTIAPHLVRLVPFYIPVYRGMKRGPWMIRAGLTLYAILGGLRKSARFRSLPRSEWATLDGLDTRDLKAVFRYHDGQTDDAALCRAVLASAIELGALVDAGAKVVAAERIGTGDARRWKVRFERGGESHECTARVVVNATGPWVNRVAQLATPQPKTRNVDLVGGTHIEVRGHLERGIYYTEAPEDQRAVFSIPWKGHIMVGTTERPYEGNPSEIQPTREEIDYLLNVHRRYFPNSKGELVAAWAGLRVLPHAEGSAFERPRDVTLVPDDEDHPSWVGVYGGKLTGYRHTAEEIMDLIRGSLPKATAKADTETLRLPELERVTVWDE
ncbi:Aerobic glycerol-3-phosphate dehydrogenase [Planctomycetes bacterium Poly30]|uniref:Aerobic glycerol-3-phosphate dehydrogenase n=1 Tax=Saltatorellus ferox TaxID=2528018 RepID=A0A518EWP3_9BACT|nr:Aerobic glycerol-3-phosphate dehydrogenase [Planctomycetes bacterium Poly30]